MIYVLKNKVMNFVLLEGPPKSVLSLEAMLAFVIHAIARAQCWCPWLVQLPQGILMPGDHEDGYGSVSPLEMYVVYVAFRGHIEDHGPCCHQSLCLVSVVTLQQGTMWISIVSFATWNYVGVQGPCVCLRPSWSVWVLCCCLRSFWYLWSMLLGHIEDHTWSVLPPKSVLVFMAHVITDHHVVVHSVRYHLMS